MARTTGLGPTSPNMGHTGASMPGAKAPRLSKLGLRGGGAGLTPGGALFLLVLLEVGVQVLFRSYFRRAHGG